LIESRQSYCNENRVQFFGPLGMKSGPFNISVGPKKIPVLPVAARPSLKNLRP